MPDIDVKIQWHSPDQVYVAIFMRDGEEWYLGGALTGMKGTPGQAVDELLAEANHLVIHGENFLTEGQISLEDRIWLFKVLDRGADFNAQEARYDAIRQANGGKDPYK